MVMTLSNARTVTGRGYMVAWKSTQVRNGTVVPVGRGAELEDVLRACEERAAELGLEMLRDLIIQAREAAAPPQTSHMTPSLTQPLE